MDQNKFKIDQMSKDNIFKVPHQYFDKLPSKIQNRVFVKNQSTLLFSIKMQWVGSLTAALVIFFIGTVFYLSPGSVEEDLLASVSADEIIEYLEYEDISTFEIAYLVDVESMIEDDEIEYLELMDEELTDKELESIYSEYDYTTEIM